jgi:CRP-like cAMP-binding protein
MLASIGVQHFSRANYYICHMPNALVSFLKLFHDIPAGDEALILSATETRIYKEGDYLFHADNICREMYFVCNGVLRIMVLNEHGNQVTYFFLKENQFCTILNSFNNNTPAHESISAACDVEVLVFSRASLNKLYTQLPYLKALIDQITQQALLDKIDLKNGYLGYDSTTRYQMFLMRQPEIAMRVPLSDVASYLGITPQSLSRIRKNIR